jgi:hypothetical protein
MPIRKLKQDKLEQYEAPMTSLYWQRNKKSSVDIHDNNFAVDRQLEDQRLTMEYNRNPQLNIPTKVDKVRSEQMIAKIGNIRPVTMKAHHVNKIVREASGELHYAIVAPPRKPNEVVIEEMDPDTHPLMKPYAKESNKKPIMSSFGHRPTSASRTFHPATMNVRLKHSEVAKAHPNQDKTGFGIPVAVLSKILHAPRIPKSLFEDAEEQTQVTKNTLDPHCLFSDPIGETPATSSSFDFENTTDDNVLRSNSAKSTSKLNNNPLNKPSWVSQNSGSQITNKKKKSKGKNISAKLSPMSQYPAWDDGFHNIKLSSKEKFAIKRSGMNMKSDLPLQERMSRFASMTVSELQMLPFCETKQISDKKIRAGFKVEPSKPSPVKGQVLYYDPLDETVASVKKERKQLNEENEKKYKEKQWQLDLANIPIVDYHPVTRLQQLKNVNNLEPVNKDDGTQIDLQERVGTKQGFEQSLQRAKNGDKEALFNYYHLSECPRRNFTTVKDALSPLNSLGKNNDNSLDDFSLGDLSDIGGGVWQQSELESSIGDDEGDESIIGIGLIDKLDKMESDYEEGL